MIDFWKPHGATARDHAAWFPGDLAMTLISHTLPLLFKAHVLGSTTARVALDAQRSTPRRFTDAMLAIHNAESRLAARVAKGGLCADQLHARTVKLAGLRCQLFNARLPDERTAEWQAVLRNVSNLQRHGSSGAALMAQQPHPEHRMAFGRDALATSFWAGALDQDALFRENLTQQAERERPYLPMGYPHALIINSILHHVERTQPTPQTNGVNERARTLDRLKRDIASAHPGLARGLQTD